MAAMLAAETLVSRPPDYPSWPERPEPVATVICEGPSAHGGRQHLLAHLAGPVVAVNRAIAYSTTTPIDFWATTDDPRMLWDDYSPLLHEGTRIFSTVNNLLIWKDLGVDIGRVYHWPATYMTEFATEEESGPLIPTLFPVLAWLLRQGTKEVRLLGADMIGSGTPGIDYEPVADEGHEMRWAVERAMLAACMRKYRLTGARIRRWNRSKRRP